MVCELLCVVSLDQGMVCELCVVSLDQVWSDLLCVVSLDQGSNLEWSVIFFVSSRLIKAPT